MWVFLAITLAPETLEQRFSTFFLPRTTWKFYVNPAYQQLLKNSRIYLHYYYRFTLQRGNI